MLTWSSALNVTALEVSWDMGRRLWHPEVPGVRYDNGHRPMAIIPCPECKQSVSDRAATCPHCGVSLARAAGSAAAAAPAAWTSSPPGTEEVVWEGGASPRLLAREIPAAFWAVVVPPLAFWLLPQVLHYVGGLRHELRGAIAEQRSNIGLVVAIAVVLFSLSR